MYTRSYFTKYLELLETKHANRVKYCSAFPLGKRSTVNRAWSLERDEKLAAVLHLHFVRAGRCAARPTGVPERRELGLLFHPPCFATSFYRNAFLSSLIIARSPLSCSCFAIRLCAGISFDRIGSENFLSNFLSAKIHRNLRFVEDSSRFLSFKF